MEAEHAGRLALPVRRTQVWERARTVAASTWFLGAIVFALTWKGGNVVTNTPSIDGSFYAGLNMALVNGLDSGSDIVVTYGPLGFLKSYIAYYEWPARLQIVYGLLLHLSLSVSLVWAIRRNFGALLAVAGAIFVAAFARGDVSGIGIRVDAGVIILALIWCVAALHRDAPDWARKVVVYGGAPFAALELLTKLNTGLLVGAMVAIALFALGGDRRRNFGIAGGLFLGTFAVLWFASGQGIDDITSYVRRGFDVIAGYTSGARLEWEQRDYDYWLAPLVVAAAAALTWVSTAGLPRLRRGGILLIVAVVTYTAIKGGFVAHEVYHMATFYGTMLGVIVAMPLPDRLPVRLAGLAVSIGAVAAAYTTSLPTYPIGNPFDNAREGAATLARLVDPARMDRQIQANRDVLTAGYAFDERTLGLLRGHTVHIDPSEAAAAWAYALDWQPLPVFQPYMAWTETLDELNADAVASSDGPERILRQNLNPLGRYPAFESPAAMLAMLCNFEVLRTAGDWEVLGRVPDRCGEPRELGTAEVRYGQAADIPEAPPGTIVFARVSGTQDEGIAGRLRTLLLRPKGREVVFNGHSPYTFITGTAEDGLILAAAPGVDYPAPFNLAPASAHITFLLDDGPADDPISIRYYAMPVDS